MIIKNSHEKILNGIQTMLIDTRINLPYYGEFNLSINFHEQDSIGTCAVNVSEKGMNFFFSPKFLDDLSQKEVNFITLHEDFHLLFDHPKRTITGQYDHKLSNIVQDMIINHVIWEDIPHAFVEIPKNKDGKNMALFVPKEYEGKLIFEELYEWMKEEKDKWQKEQNSKCKDNSCKSCNGTGKQDGQGQSQKQDSQSQGDNQGQGDGQGQQDSQSGQGDGQGQQDCPDCDGTGNEGGKDSSGKPSYGPYGKNPKNGESLDTWSKEQIFQDMENGTGEYLDKHINDEVPQEMREGIVKDVMERLAARGLSAGDVEGTLNKLRKKRKDYLREIKRAVSNMIFGTQKQKTIVKPNRKGIIGLKGNRKVKTKINVILDVSGSMHGLIEKVLNYVFRNDIEINLIQADTQVNAVESLKSGKNLERVKLIGFGGTILQPAVDYVVENCNQYNTVILTDGYCDSLNLSELRGKVLIISAGIKVPITRSNGKMKQIVVDQGYE